MTKLTPIQLITQLEQPALSLRKTLSLNELSQFIGESFGKIAAYLGDKNYLLTDVPFISYANFENFTDQNIDAEVIFPLAAKVEGNDEIEAITIPQGKVIFAIYRGDYNEMSPFYVQMMEWIKEKDYKHNGTSREYYYTSEDTPLQDQMTKIVMPID